MKPIRRETNTATVLKEVNMQISPWKLCKVYAFAFVFTIILMAEDFYNWIKEHIEKLQTELG